MSDLTGKCKSAAYDAIFEESEKAADRGDNEHDDDNDNNTDYYDDFQPTEEDMKAMEDIFHADSDTEFVSF